jgi:hypothetical protein
MSAKHFLVLGKIYRKGTASSEGFPVLLKDLKLALEKYSQMTQLSTDY